MGDRIEIILKSGKTIDLGYGELKVKCDKVTGKIAGLYFNDLIGRMTTLLYIDPKTVAAIVGRKQEWRDAK